MALKPVQEPLLENIYFRLSFVFLVSRTLCRKHEEPEEHGGPDLESWSN